MWLVCPVCFRPLCQCIISAEALTLFFCCLASAPLFFRKCRCTCVCCVPAVLQSVWLLYSASAGVGRLLAETLWCSAHVISLISLCVCIQMSAGFRLRGACEHTWVSLCAQLFGQHTSKTFSPIFTVRLTITCRLFKSQRLDPAAVQKNILIMLLSVTVSMLWRQQIRKPCCDYCSCFEFRVCS